MPNELLYLHAKQNVHASSVTKEKVSSVPTGRLDKKTLSTTSRDSTESGTSLETTQTQNPTPSDKNRHGSPHSHRILPTACESTNTQPRKQALQAQPELQRKTNPALAGLRRHHSHKECRQRLGHSSGGQRPLHQRRPRTPLRRLHLRTNKLRSHGHLDRSDQPVHKQHVQKRNGRQYLQKLPTSSRKQWNQNTTKSTRIPLQYAQ